MKKSAIKAIIAFTLAIFLTKSAASQEISENLEDKAKTLKWGRDPFVYNAGNLSKERADLKLDGILWEEENPQAVLNDIIVEIGDEIGIFTVINIKPDRVILNDGTKDFEVVIK